MTNPLSASTPTPSLPASVPPPLVLSPGQTTEVGQARSPLRQQHREKRGSYADYTPVKLIFLSGAHKGKSLDIGLAVNEVIHSQNGDWEDRDAGGVRVGANFRRIGARYISMSLEFFDVGGRYLPSG